MLDIPSGIPILESMKPWEWPKPWYEISGAVLLICIFILVALLVRAI
jgi:uncharacterized membrane protein YwaF